MAVRGQTGAMPAAGRRRPQDGGGLAAASPHRPAGYVSAGVLLAAEGAEVPAEVGVAAAVDDGVDDDGAERQQQTQSVDEAETAGRREDGVVHVGDDVDDGDGQPLHGEGYRDHRQQRQVLPVPGQLLLPPLALRRTHARQLHSPAQKTADEQVQGHDGGCGQGELEEEDDHGVDREQLLCLPVLHAQRQHHLPRLVVHVLQAVGGGQGRGQGHGQQPDGGQDQTNRHSRVQLAATHTAAGTRHGAVPHGGGADDGAVPLDGDGQDGEDGDEDVGQLQEGHDAAQQLAQPPVLLRQPHHREGHAQHAHQHVRHHQVQQVPMAGRPEQRGLPSPAEHERHQHVGGQPQKRGQAEGQHQAELRGGIEPSAIRVKPRGREEVVEGEVVCGQHGPVPGRV